MVGHPTVFGFELDAPFPLRTAREGAGGDPLVIEVADLDEQGTGEILVDWRTGDMNALDATLRTREDGGYLLDITDSGKYLIDPESRHVITPIMGDEPRREARLLGLPMLLCFLARGDVSLHGAAVMGPTGAIVLAAPGRHGKTSLAAAVVRLGQRLLTEDLCCLHVGEKISLYPGPASLRVRPDMAEHVLPIDGMKEVGMLDDRMVLASRDPGDGAAVDVAGIVLLKGFEDSLVLREVEALDRLSDLWLLSFHLPNAKDRARKFDQLVGMLDVLPVWELTQPSDPTKLMSTADSVLSSLS